MTTALTAVLVFGLIVFFHEFGHFAVAKIVGIKVHEFAIGMGPRLIKHRKGETEYSLRILPIGGYVRMEGEDETSDDIRSFNKKTIGERIAVIFAGPLMNFILAIFLFAIIFYNVSGLPITTIEQIIQNSPADIAGIEVNDKIIGINDEDISNWKDVVNQIDRSQGNTIKITLMRNGEAIEKSITPETDVTNNRFVIGIIPVTEKSLTAAIKDSYNQTKMIFIEMFNFFSGLISRKPASNTEVVGPVGIINLVGQASKEGLFNVLFLAGLISINLGFINLLPIPALDGSRILFLIFEFFRGKAVDPEREAIIHAVGLALMMLLMLIITYKDILTLFKG